jgi:hypothetical protein
MSGPNYDDLQKRLGNALAVRRKQEKRAIEIVASIASVCGSVLQFPPENIQFKATGDNNHRDEQQRSYHPGSVIDRDEKGNWSADLILGVDSVDPAGCRTETYIRVEIGLDSDGNATVSLNEPDLSIDVPADAEIAPIVTSLAQDIAEHVKETGEWVATGIGARAGRTVGFNARPVSEDNKP